MSSRAVTAALSPEPVRIPDGLAALRSAAQAATSARCPNGTLSDLYSGIDAPAFRDDLERAEAEARAFTERYAGRVGAIAAGPDASVELGRAVAAFEAIEDLMGRLMSFAGLVYSGDTTDETRAKFYGDTRERLTAASATSCSSGWS